MNLKKPVTRTGRAVVSHGQTVKQSHAYQTIEAHYSVSREVDDDAASVRTEMRRQETEIETRLLRKLKEQRKFLSALGEANS